MRLEISGGVLGDSFWIQWPHEHHMKDEIDLFGTKVTNKSPTINSISKSLISVLTSILTWIEDIKTYESISFMQIISEH